MGAIAFDRMTVGDWERLQLVAVPPEEISAHAARTADAIEAMMARPLDLALIDGTAEQDAAVLQAVARLAPSHQLEALAASLIASPQAGRSLARLFPEDGLAVAALPALADWAAARAEDPRPGAEAPQVLGAGYDFLTTLGHDGAAPSLAHTCTMLARRSVLPRRDLCIVAIARNEGIYLLDWLAYHRAIGVQDVFLYTNDNSDGSDVLLAALAQAGAIRWTRNEVASGSRAQPKAYGHALAVRPETLDYRWAMVIDLDEYFVPNPALFRSALDFLHWHEAQPCDAIAVNWVFHGPGQAARWTEDFVARRFPYAAGEVDEHVKCIVRPSAVLYSAPHCPLPPCQQPIRFHASDGQPHVASQVTNTLAHSARPTAEYAWINHYFYKSSEEFLWKFARNRGNGPRQVSLGNRTLPAGFVRAFMATFDSKHEALAGPEAFGAGFEDERARLMALPGVAAAWSHVKRCYAEQVAAMLPAFVDAPGIVQAGEAGVAFLATLGMAPHQQAAREAAMV